MVLVPNEEMLDRMACRAPVPSATTATTDAMPMMIPSMVRKVRMRWAFIARNAMRKASAKRSRQTRQPLLPTGWVTAGVATPADRPVPVARSSTIRPSRISMMRCACSATAMSCVTSTTVWPSACSSPRIFITSLPECVSNAPVGSSAKITAPPFISARAIETRCCWPPDSSPGRCCMRSPRPSRDNSVAARAWRASAGMPA
ncbi:Protein of uncharacterised function (DUF1602) [Stenotrophomonas maltophilia]|nr:Protein of uncharacterised function (DUF1602) [Stenotrophomonas maltophilia]